MENKDEDLYDIDKYSDNDLFNMLDMNNPSDRELEAKIVMTINKYEEMESDDAHNLKHFFEQVYDRFFENDEESRVIELDSDDSDDNDTIKEGFEGKKSPPIDKELFGKNELSAQTEADTNLVQTTPLFYGASQLNPLLKETQKRVLQLDSQFRNYENYPHSTDYIINLSEQLHNVVSLRLHSVSIPYTWYNVSNVYNANYFKLLGNVDGIKGVYDLTFDISAGTYNTEQLMVAVNASIADVASKNTDIDFGTTGVAHDIETSKVTLTIDIQQVYSESNFFIYFDFWTSPFDSSGSIDPITGGLQTQTQRQLSIPGFLGFGNLVIPKYKNTNFIPHPTVPVVSVENAYSMESIYSHYDYCFSITGKSTPSGSPLEYNSFNPNQTFYTVIDDVSNNVVGNNYFSIVTFNGPDPYDPQDPNVLGTVKIEFCDTSGFYTRATLLEAINRSLLENEFLSSNASLNFIDISYNEQDGTINNTITMQRFQLRTLLNRKKNVNVKDNKQIIIFPDEQEVFNSLTANIRTSWTGPLWQGINSCFLFDDDDKFTQSNAVIAEVGHLRTLYPLTTNPQITLRCMKNYPIYNVTENNRTVTIPTSAAAGYTDGYKLIDYFGVAGYDDVYQFSELNAGFSMINSSITNGHVDVSAFYDVGRSLCRIQIDMNTYFDETMYTFDFTNSFLNDLDQNGNNSGAGGGSGFIITDSSYSVITGLNGPGDDANGDHELSLDIACGGPSVAIPAGPDASGETQSLNTIYKKNPTFVIGDKFPITISSNNNRIVVDISGTVPGLADLTSANTGGNWPYTIYIPEGTYSQPYLLVNAINKTFASIQGETDPNGNPLYGLNLTQSRFYMAYVEEGDTADTYDWALKVSVNNNLTELDYQLELSDTITTYENPWIDANGNNRYSLDSSGDLITSANSPFQGTSWNAYLGFTDFSYSLIPPNATGTTQLITGTEVLGSRDVMNDISGAIIIYENNIADNAGTVKFNQNNVLTFLPQTNVTGLIDASGVKRIEVNLPGGIYPYYSLLNAINIQFQITDELKSSIVYDYFSSTSDEDYTVFQMNINKIYTAQDYILEFYNSTEVPISDKVRNITSATSFQAVTWDVTLGWLIGFRSFPNINLNQTDVSNSLYVEKQSYSLDASTGIITMVGDTGVDLFLYKTLYLIIDDFTQNHLNDGLITGVRNNPLANTPSYTSNATKVCNPQTGREQASIFNSAQPGMGLTENQLYAANSIARNNFISQTTRIYSDPPYVKDMFATIPIKVSSLKQGDLFVEYGGTLQDNDRKYFGPVNISKMNIKLLNDHGDVINLNGNNWSFSLVFEYLYNLKGI